MIVPDIVGIVGSRGPDLLRNRPTGWTNYPLVLELCRRVQKNRHEQGEPATIVSGGATSGVDRHVRMACQSLKFCFGEHLVKDPTTVDCPKDHFHEIPAQWRNPDGTTNRKAGFERNDKLVRHCSLVIALFAPGKRTPGTSHVIERCRVHEIPFMVYHEGVWT